MEESMGGTVPLASSKQSGRVEHHTPPYHTHSQQLQKHHHQNLSKPAAYWQGTTSNTKPSGRNQQPSSRTKSVPIKETANTSHPSTQLSSQPSETNKIQIKERPRSMAGCKEPIPAIQNNQTSPKKTQTLQN